MADFASLDVRVQGLADEVDRLRRNRHLADNQLQQMLLKIAEVQLNLATQDKTLARLDASVNGNGRMGLSTRVDRVERTAANLIRLGWIVIAGLVTAATEIAMQIRR